MQWHRYIQIKCIIIEDIGDEKHGDQYHIVSAKIKDIGMQYFI